MTKRGWWILLAVAVPVLAIAFWFAACGPVRRTSMGGGRRAAMMALVPEGAEEIVVIPAAGAVFRALRANRLTQPALDDWAESHQNPSLPLLLGGADVVFWRNGQQSGFIAAAGALRTFIARLYLRSRGNGTVSVERGLLISGGHDRGLDPALIRAATSLSQGMEGHFFVLLLPGSHFGYPPGGRPAVTAITLGSDTLDAESRAAASRPRTLQAMPVALPVGALVSGAIDPTSEATHLLRSVPGSASELLASATAAVVYDVDERKFIPRIHGLLVFPASERARVLDRITHPMATNILGILGGGEGERRVVNGVEIVRYRGLGYSIETALKGDQLLVGFDKGSVEQRLGDADEASPWRGERGFWCARVRPDLLWPIVHKLQGREELKLISSDLYRDVDRAEEWSRWISNCGTAWVLASGNGQIDMTRARLVARPK